MSRREISEKFTNFSTYKKLLDTNKHSELKNIIPKNVCDDIFDESYEYDDMMRNRKRAIKILNNVIKDINGISSH